MMGAGKSTVGAIVAERLGRRHIDTDAEVERSTGSNVSDVFASRGEEAFRLLESEALRDAVASHVASVVSVGGGAVLDAGNRSAMAASGVVVWLRARPDSLWTRVGDTGDRPLLRGASDADRRAVLGRLDAERRPLYEEVASVVVDVDDRAPEDVASEVLAALSEVGRDHVGRRGAP